MILSGAQSTLVGIIFVYQANSAEIPNITAIAPYAAFGAFYFPAAALWLTASEARRRTGSGSYCNGSRCGRISAR